MRTSVFNEEFRYENWTKDSHIKWLREEIIKIRNTIQNGEDYTENDRYVKRDYLILIAKIMKIDGYSRLSRDDLYHTIQLQLNGESNQNSFWTEFFIAVGVRN